MLFNKRDTVLIDKIEYICYREDEHLGILIQNFISDDDIKEIVRIVEHEYVFIGIKIKNSETYLLFMKDFSSE